MKIDSFDKRILTLLANDGRMSWRDLADAIGLSLTPTIRRVRHLEEIGLIQGYGAKLNEAALAGQMSVMVHVSLMTQSSDAMTRFDQAVIALPEVMECFLMTGDSDYMMRVVVRDLDHYQRFVHAIANIEGINNIKSSFALKPIIIRKDPSILS